MASAIDVAAYILTRQGEMTAMKLQKLVYYSQAWALVWDEQELFPEAIEAWANGPVVRDLYRQHQGKFRISPGFFLGADVARLTEPQRETIDRVLEFYGPKSAQWLSDLTHMEAPWKDARAAAGAKPGELCSQEITQAAMAEYYANLPPVHDAEA